MGLNHLVMFDICRNDCISTIVEFDMRGRDLENI